MNGNGWRLLTTTTMLAMLAGCRAPLPKMRSLLSPPGSTTVAAPGTGAISDSYYPATSAGGATAPGSGGASGLPSAPPYQPRVVPATPLDPPPSADKLPPASDLDVSQGAPTRLRISRSTAQGVSWSVPRAPAPSTGQGAAAQPQAAAPPQEPRPFLPPVKMLEMSELPDAPPPRTSAPVPRVTAPPVLTTPAATPTIRAVGGDLWQSRNQ